jgi:hypothetical protein
MAEKTGRRGAQPMLTHRQIHQMAIQYEKAYPTTLARRLEWWNRVVKINRILFLQLLDMSPEQAEENKDRSWKEILQDPEWETPGRVVENRLSSLLTIYHYDFKGFADILRQPPDGAGPGASAVEVGKEKGSPAQDVANGQSPEALSPFTEGELLAFARLQGYLAYWR